jgi:hypothetical protein
MKGDKMKPIFILLLSIVCPLLANAEIIKGQNETTENPFHFSLTDFSPQKHRCDPNNPDPGHPPDRPDPNDSVACAEKAYSGPFSREESIELCQGARGLAPATCAQTAYSGPFSKTEAIQLCKNAISNAPIDCAYDAYSGPFSREESIRLCAQSRTKGPVECAKKAYSGPFSKDEAIELCAFNGELANAECAIKAYSGPYSKEEAVRMCKNNPHLALRSLNIIEKAFQLKGAESARDNKMKLQNFLRQFSSDQ